MNRISLIVLYICILSLGAKAEDIIVFKTGELVKGKVEEISEASVKYRNASNPTGPLYVVDKGNILSISYENGTQEILTSITTQSQSQSLSVTSHEIQRTAQQASGLSSESVPMLIDKPASPDNTYIINQYKVPHDYYDKPKNPGKITDQGTVFLAFTDESILSNEDLTVQFDVTPCLPFGILPSGKMIDWWNASYHHVEPFYVISFINKTAKTLYIDLANSYTMGGDGICMTFYDDKVYNETHTSGKSNAFNLGGITNALGIGGVIGALANGTTLGTHSTNGISVTSSNPRFLILHPHATVSIPKRKYAGDGEIIEKPEYIPRPNYSNIPVRQNEVKYYNEGDLPYGVKFCFTYSDSPSFKTYSQMNSELYCYEIFGGLFKQLNSDLYKFAHRNDYKYGISERLHNGMCKFIIYQRYENKSCNGIPTYSTLTGKRINN